MYFCLLLLLLLIIMCFLFFFSSLALLHIILYYIYIFLCDGWKLYYSVLRWNGALWCLAKGCETCAVKKTNKTKTAAAFLFFFGKKMKKQTKSETNQRLSTCPLIYWPCFFCFFFSLSFRKVSRTSWGWPGTTSAERVRREMGRCMWVQGEAEPFIVR